MFKENRNFSHFHFPASFKLVTFEETGLAVVLIRGTQNPFDLLADSQLWSAAILMQVLRSILPLGGAWTPILDGKLLHLLFAFRMKVRFTPNTRIVHFFPQK
jgi:hypothetical protein